MTLFKLSSRAWRAAYIIARNPSRLLDIFFHVVSSKKKISPNRARILSEREIESAHQIYSIPVNGLCVISDEDLIAAAEEIRLHSFNLLGSGRIFFGKHIPWTLDFKSGHDWGTKPTRELMYGNGDGRDIKTPWELSRFYHAPILALAFQRTGNGTYLNEMIFQIEDWIESNPFEHGPNWMNAMEVGIRAANWCLALDCLRALTPDFHKRFPEWNSRVIQSLYEHAVFIETHLEYGPLISNHYLSDVVGLVYLGVFLKGLPESDRWRAIGVSGLEECMKRQVYDDGVDFESSIPYHRLATELFGYAALVCRFNGYSLSDEFWTKLWNMFEFSHQYEKPNGLAPQIGDCDNGRLHILTQPFNSWDPSDHRHLRILAKTLWPEREHCERKSILFPHGQIAILRSKSMYCIVDAGPNGQDGNGGHCHNDILSFELSVNGLDFIVDTGTGCYTSDLDRRNDFRSTRMHNTVMVDGQEQNRVPAKEQGVFWMYNDAAVRVIDFQTIENRAFFSAEHTGYKRLADPVIHRRALTLNELSEELIIRDEFRCAGSHSFEWNFHLAPTVRLSHGEEGKILLQSGSVDLCFSMPTGVAYSIVRALFSPSYGIITESSSIRCSPRSVSLANFEFSFKVIG